MARVMVVAGEVSGDMHAARVVRKIREMVPEVEFFGMGSSRLAAEGVEILIDPTGISTIGFAEALKNIKIHLQHARRLRREIRRRRPDVLFLVDYSGFNMWMARIARKEGVPAVNYFPPTAWIWGQWRAKWMAWTGATIATVFPQEHEIYRQAGADVRFVGHPLVDVVEVDREKEEIYPLLDLDPRKPIIGLMPGSRPSEIDYLLPEMLEAAVKLQGEYPQLQLVLPLADSVDAEKICDQLAEYRLVIKVARNYNYELMKVADLLILASGTATLEAAIMGTPMIIVYKTSDSSYYLGKKLINVDHIGMPNIIAQKEVVPEILQEDVSADKIWKTASQFLKRPYAVHDIKKDLGYIRQQLGGKGAISRIARLVLEEGKIH